MGTLSVIMPIFNAADTLGPAVESVLAQSYRDVEIILVNDGSSDDSLSVCRRLAAADQRVVVVDKPNGGVSSARNAGLDQASGEFVAFVDADDHLLPHALETAMGGLTTGAGDLVCFGMMFVRYRGAELLSRTTKSVGRDLVLASSAELECHFLELLRTNYLSSVWNKVYRLSLFRDTGIRFSEDMAILEDLDVVLRLLCLKPRVVVLAASLYEYYIDDEKNSLSRRPDIDYIKNFQVLEASVESMCATFSLSNVARSALHGLCFRAYCIGLEMICSRALCLRRKLRELRLYASAEAVQRAARDVAGSRISVRVLAFAVRRCSVLTLYLVVSGWQSLLKLRRLGTRFCRRASSFRLRSYFGA